MAQIVTKAGTFIKPSAGDIVTEISFAPNLGGTGMFQLPNLAQGSDIIAFKFRKFKNDKKCYRFLGNFQFANDGSVNAKTYYTVAAGWGVEHHLLGAERLSTYWGYDFNIGYTYNSDSTNSASTSTKKIGLGATAFTGFDYYVVPRLYLGVEVSYGFGLVNSTPDGGKSTTSFELAPHITPFFRLGWKL